jgi:UDP-glucose 4-epimerase
MSVSGVKNLVFSSSATVYGAPCYLPIDEFHPTIPSSPYGRTKLIVENILADVVESDTKWKVAILRYFNPTGAHESGLIGERPNGVPNNLMPFIAQVASKRLEELSIFGNDYETSDGTGIRDYIHVVDLAKGHLAALNTICTSERTQIETWNLGTGEGYSVLETVRTFERVNGISIPYRIVPRRPGDIAACYADTGKAEANLGWRAELGLEDMCLSAWKSERHLNAADGK